ncbi:MAG: hypothetical protein ACXVLQ_11930 [Bacteriovorax sp.]
MNSLYHFYLTFNPYLNQGNDPEYSQAHEFYDLLRNSVHSDPKASCYWGKMISKDREARVDIASLHKVLEQNNAHQFSTHLYITDFQNLWVGKIKSIRDLLPKDANTLSFYKDKKVEVWFEIEDFILLEHGHNNTASRLRDFQINNEYSQLEINALSPFTTGVKYPCIIEDKIFDQYFDEIDPNESSHLVLKENPNIHRSNTQQVTRALNNYIFPEDLYARIPHAAKLEIETAELDILEKRHHNIHKIAFSYLKALEITLNDLIIHQLKRKGVAREFFVDLQSSPPKILLADTRSDTVTLQAYNKNFSLNQLLYFVENALKHNHPEFKKAFSDHKDLLRYLVKDFSDIVRNNHLIEIRNAIAHGDQEKVSVKDAMAVRNIILGIGSPGLIAQCYFLLEKEKFRHHYEVTEFEEIQKPRNKLKLVG